MRGLLSLKVGLGQPYTFRNLLLSWLISKKGEEEWGEQPHITLVVDHELIIGLAVYPYPFTEYLRIGRNDTFNISCSFLIVTFSGQIIVEYPILSRETKNHRGTLPSGIYFYQIMDENSTLIQSDKLLIL